MVIFGLGGRDIAARQLERWRQRLQGMQIPVTGSEPERSRPDSDMLGSESGLSKE